MPSILERRFAQFLREQRGDLSYGVFAKKLGISKPTVYAIETGARAPSFEMIEKIQGKLKVSLVDIFGEMAHRVPGRFQSKKISSEQAKKILPVKDTGLHD